MTRLQKITRDKILELKIERLKLQQILINQKIKNITRHLSGPGYNRRIRPCDIDDPNEMECPWPIE